MFMSATVAEVMEHLNALQRRGAVALTNYFRQALPESGIVMDADADGLVFLVPELSFYRLFFAAPSGSQLSAKLRTLPRERPIVSGCVCRALPDPLRDVLLAAGFAPHAVFRRMSLAAVPRAKVNTVMTPAVPGDADELYSRLVADFDPLTSHLPDLAQLRAYMAEGWVFLNRRQGALCGYVVFHIHGKSANFNYIFNHSDNVMDCLLLQNNFYATLQARGVRSAILWVDERNTGVIRMHTAYGWKPDGLQDHFYVLPALSETT